MRIDKIISQHESNRNDKITDIGFITPDARAVHQFGIEFKNFSECLKYCDANGIKYTKERGPFGMDAYDFQ